jgi:hypothetical protein
LEQQQEESVLTTLSSSLKTSLLSAATVIFSLMIFSGANARDFEKIPIEQAIRESKEAHSMERLAKIRQLTKQLDVQQELGVYGALPTQYQYDVHYYRLDLRVDIATEIVYGRVDMISSATQDNVTFCEIDLFSNMVVDSVRFDDGLATFTRISNVVKVNLPSPVNTGQTFTVYTFYHGHPIEGGFQAFSFDSYGGNPVISTLSEPFLARTWWPCKDYPDDKADSVDVIITYPSNLFCSSNGTMVANIDHGDGTRTTSWKIRYPIATYLVSLAMSNYSHWRDWFVHGDNDSMPVDFWVYPSQLAAAQSGYAPTVSMIDTLSRLFGLYPFVNEKYAMSMFNWGGAMEHQTNTSIINNYYAQSMIVHELGHQWWGDMITCRDWHHIWMNEGFASYVEALWFESSGGFTALRSYMNGMRYTSGGSIYCTDTTDVWAIFDSRVYDKGAWVVHMLRNVVGESNFWKIMHAYYADPRYKWKDVTTESFRDLCEEQTGMDLHPFFQDWIYGTYYPKYAVSYAYDQTSPNSYRVYVHVRQYQTTNPTVFRMANVALSVYNGSYHDFSVSNTLRDQDYILDLTGVTSPPSSVSIDRNDWILKSTSTESYAVHIIYDVLDNGTQFSTYADTLTVRGGTLPYSFQIMSGSLPAGLELNTTKGIISGTPVDTGSVQVSIKATGTTGGSETKLITFRIAPGAYLPGDADADGTVTISDAVYLITYIFSSGPAPEPMAAGDVNADCMDNISDAVYLINYIFGGGPAPLPGC